MHDVDVDSTVSLYNLQSLELQEQLVKTKGATVFAITSNIEKDSDGVPTIISRLAISVKRKLLVYSWHDAELVDPEVSHIPLMSLIVGISAARSSEVTDVDVLDQALSWSLFRLYHPRHFHLNFL
jgi:hypothetical protein